jgi:hypothetical protein
VSGARGLQAAVNLARHSSEPEGLTVLAVASDREIIAKIEQLISSTDA